jgi:hypothetical protein
VPASSAFARCPSDLAYYDIDPSAGVAPPLAEIHADPTGIFGG